MYIRGGGGGGFLNFGDPHPSVNTAMVLRGGHQIAYSPPWFG